MENKKCRICNKSFNKKTILCSRECALEDNRIRNGYSRLELTCPVCEIKFMVPKRKINSKHNDICCSIKCANMLKSKNMKRVKKSEETVRRQNLSKTKDKIYKQGDYPCLICSKYFNNNLSLRAHSSWCKTKEETAICICGNKFTNLRNLKMHQKMWCESLVPSKKEEICKKISEAVYTSETRIKSSFNSIPETNLYLQIKDLYPSAIPNFTIVGVNHIYDMFVKELNLIIEFDGDYWHGNPIYYPTLTNVQIEKQRKDLYANKKAIKNNYFIHRVWQSEAEEYYNQFKKEHLNGIEAMQDFVNKKNWRNKESV